jgi:hypothetical protein
MMLNLIIIFTVWISPVLAQSMSDSDRLLGLALDCPVEWDFTQIRWTPKLSGSYSHYSTVYLLVGNTPTISEQKDVRNIVGIDIDRTVEIANYSLNFGELALSSVRIEKGTGSGWALSVECDKAVDCILKLHRGTKDTVPIFRDKQAKASWRLCDEAAASDAKAAIEELIRINKMIPSVK